MSYQRKDIPMPTTITSSISRDDVVRAAGVVFALIEAGEVSSVMKAASDYRMYLDRLLGTDTLPVHMISDAAAAVSVFRPASEPIARNVAHMIRAVIDRGLTDLKIPSDPRDAFSVNVALLNGRDLPVCC
jgi:hypothetical protein